MRQEIDSTEVVCGCDDVAVACGNDVSHGATVHEEVVVATREAVDFDGCPQQDAEIVLGLHGGAPKRG